MAKIHIPAANWHMELVDALENAVDGDTIVVDTEAMRELGLSAKKRMCPDKDITFEVERSNA